MFFWLTNGLLKQHRVNVKKTFASNLVICYIAYNLIFGGIN